MFWKCFTLVFATAFVGVGYAIYVATEPPPKPDPKDIAAAMDRFSEDARFVMPPVEPLVDLPSVTRVVSGGDIQPQELIIGVAIDGASRAYPINLINTPFRKVINDTLADEPIVVTWCDNCHSAAVFSRKLQGRNELFGCSGILWKESLVFYDETTGSFWNNVRGEAVSGPRRGQKLKPIDAAVTTWKEWTEAHPDTTVVHAERIESTFSLDYYHKLRAKGPMVMAVRTRSGGVAWDLDALNANPVQTGTIDDVPVVVFFHAPTMSARVFDRRLGGQELAFKLDGEDAIDDATGSRWDVISGTAIDGLRRGRSLTPMPGLVTLTATWEELFPESRIVGDSRRRTESMEAGGG
ncbi:MAG: DUF3179 domain-containing protein [Planctomyces sp.]|nr:DUF3179 domain-containing protein [Planctomyces sp.]